MRGGSCLTDALLLATSVGMKSIVSPSRLFVLFALFVPVTAEALFRGDEFEPRDYQLARHYFINRFSYLPLPDALERFDATTNAFIGAGGSLRSDDLYLYQHLKVQQAATPSFDLFADYLRDRDFDGTFQRFSIGARYHLTPAWSVELLGQPSAVKAEADIGTAVTFSGRRLYSRAQVLLPLFVFGDKNPDDASVQRQPVNLQWDLSSRIGSNWSVYFTSDVDLPSRFTNPRQSFVFDFERYAGTLGTRYQFTDNSHVRLDVEGEHGSKQRVGLVAGDRNDFFVDRDYISGTLEWWRRRPDHGHQRAGFYFVYFDEDNVYPFNEAESLRLERTDRILYAGRTWRLRERLQLNTLLLINVLDDRRESLDDDERRNDTVFLGRATASLQYTIERLQLEAGSALNFDQTRFGGGFVRAFMDF